MKFNETLDLIIKKALDENVIPMLVGEVGIGKSSYVQNLAKVKNTKAFVVACNELGEKTDLTGARLVPINEKLDDFKQVFYPHADIKDAILYANEHPDETPILFFDELNRTTPDITSALLSIATNRRVGKDYLPANIKMLIAGNDKGHVTALDEASVSRFLILNVEPDANTFLNLPLNLHPYIKNVLNANTHCIFCKKDGNILAINNAQANDDDDENNGIQLTDLYDDETEMAQLTTPRTIAALSRWLNTCTTTELGMLCSESNLVNGREISVLQEIIEGFVGETEFTIHLLEEITNALNSGATANTPGSIVAIGKPQQYDNMKACANMTDLNEFIQNLSDQERSSHLVYAMQENEDNELYLKALAEQITAFDPNNMRTLMGLFATDQLDQQNVETLLATQTQLASTLSLIMQAA